MPGEVEAPIHPDDLVRFESDQRDMPEDMRREAGRRSLVFSTRNGNPVDLRAVMNAAPGAQGVIELDGEIIEGVLARADRSDDIPQAEGDAAPAPPPWAGMKYLPTPAVRNQRPMLRRLSGKDLIRPNIVVGNDDRTVYYPSGYPWHCIGRVYVSTNPSSGGWSWTGSAALISDNAVLTAGHVVPWGAANWSAKFVPAHYDGTSIYGPGFERWVTSAQGYNSAGEVAGYDAAVMRLQSPLSLGFFGSKVYSSSWDGSPFWTHCGYAGSVSGTRPNFQGGIVVHDTDSDSPGLEVEHYGDVTPGDSGGPLFAWWSNGPHIVGTHSGDETEYRFPFGSERVNVDAGGDALNNLVTWARANW